MQSTTIAVDLAKSVFQIAVSRHPGKVSESHRLSRSQFLRFFAERQPAPVVLEACGTAHHWARELGALGHQVRLLPPHEVRSYVHRSKTDRADAAALLEAHRNERIRSVPVLPLPSLWARVRSPAPPPLDLDPRPKGGKGKEICLSRPGRREIPRRRPQSLDLPVPVALDAAPLADVFFLLLAALLRIVEGLQAILVQDLELGELGRGLLPDVVQPLARLLAHALLPRPLDPLALEPLERQLVGGLHPRCLVSLCHGRRLAPDSPSARPAPAPWRPL